jgi:hypothetical protein
VQKGVLPPGRSETVGDTKTEERGGQETVVQTDAGFVSTGRRHDEHTVAKPTLSSTAPGAMQQCRWEQPWAGDIC